ncbi:MAG: iron ABC transporter permease [Gammaproteobacteria bacterium]|nr:iron ABC transporter permease [Gammaproteobacteria bacterium]
MRHGGTTSFLVALVPVSLLFALDTGSVHIGWIALWHALAGKAPALDATIIWRLRLPRTAAAFAVGALLSLSGALLQVLLRNPLADPYVLGISGGAAVAALGSMLLGIGSAWLGLNAFLGSLVSMAIVFGLSHLRGPWTQTRLLLTGVVVAAGWGAAISFMLAVSPASNVQGMLFWLIGDLSYARHIGWAYAALAGGLLLSMPLARSLNLYSRGELVAASLGVSIGLVRTAVYVLASLMTAAAVMLAGSVGFVGLIIPHLLRLLGDSDYRRLLPDSALLGGSFLVVCDTLARSAMAPLQLPVGVITALLGVPVFLILLARARVP